MSRPRARAIVTTWIGRWYRRYVATRMASQAAKVIRSVHLTEKQIRRAMTVLVLLTFSKQFFWQACRATYILPHRQVRHIDPRRPAMLVCISRRIGHRHCGRRVHRRQDRPQIRHLVLDLGAAPFALCLPYAGYAVTIALSVIVGLVISSAFSAILVFATELKPAHIGTIAGLFFRPLVRSGRHRSRILRMACRNDRHTICIPREHTPPLLGIVAALLPDMKPADKKQ